jgi:phosphoglycolate phosphatase-like HAD superfamily hydrolase
MNVHEFRTWIFDCDGVILDSNNLKTDAFFEVVLPYGKEHAEKFIEYHKRKGGVSRYEKFRYFFEEIVKKQDYGDELVAALDAYSAIVRAKMIDSDETEGMRDLLSAIPKGSKKIVVSGGDENELREVFRIKGIDRLFDEIFGSPRDKRRIIRDTLERNMIQRPVVFIGDSQFDYAVAGEFGFDFVFMSGYSEFPGWKDFFCHKPEIPVISSLSDIIEKINDSGTVGCLL